MFEDSKQIVVSFCTTCTGRLSQLRQTFDANSLIIANNPNAEWIIVNMGSDSDLDVFMTEKLLKSCKRIIYLRELSNYPWHLSIAKNMAHRLASGEILMSLDCDNFIDDGLKHIVNAQTAGCNLLHLWSGTYGDGTCGRIAISRKLFYDIGGYDESFFPMGYQDIDLLKRAVAFGARQRVVVCKSGVAIVNSKLESMSNCLVEGKTWQDFALTNKRVSMANIAQGKLTANLETVWKDLNVERFIGNN